jgi:hypothetical protein
MTLRDEIEARIRAEQKNDEAFHKAFADFEASQRERFEALRLWLDELAASCNPTFVLARSEECGGVWVMQGTVQVGQTPNGEFLPGKIWRIYPNCDRQDGFEGRGSFVSSEGFVVLEDTYGELGVRSSRSTVINTHPSVEAVTDLILSGIASQLVHQGNSAVWQKAALQPASS